MAMNSKKNNNETENKDLKNKEDQNMAAYDDEMDLRDEAQIEAEENDGEYEGKKEIQPKKAEELNFYQRHKKAIWITGGVVAGVAVVGVGLYGVHNIGMGRTFFGRPKFNGGHRHHGHHGNYNNYRVDAIPQTQQQVDIPATENDTSKVVNFADGAAKVVDAAKTVGDMKVNNL